MKLKKSYTFLYMPEDHGHSREYRVPWWSLALSLAAITVLVLTGALYGVGLSAGTSWLPGGSVYQQENLALRATIAGLEGQISELRAEVDEVFAVQNMVAGAINLAPVDAETFAAGIGGRGGLDLRPNEVPGLTTNADGQTSSLGDELDQMLRQAKIQRQGYLAMLDTLSARQNVRDHIPSIRPTDTGWTSSRFGFRRDPFTGKQTFHRGLDFSTPVGTPVRATGDGIVLAVQQQRGFGRVVKIDHGGGVTTVYAHLNEALVESGARVKRGEIIAKSGNSGRSSAPHLHYEIRLGDRPVNPLAYILDSYAARQ